MFPRNICRELFVLGLVLAAAGCNSNDERLVEATREASNRQAEQNKVVAEQNQQLAETARELVAADAKARQELIAAQAALENQVQAERASLDRQHEALEQERRDLAAHRHREPILANAITRPPRVCWSASASKTGAG